MIGYWFWELPVGRASWRAGLRFVHEVWAPSRFTAAALAPSAARSAWCRCRLRCGRRRPRRWAGRAFGLPQGAFVTLVDVQPGLELRAQEPAGRDRGAPARVRRPGGSGAGRRTSPTRIISPMISRGCSGRAGPTSGSHTDDAVARGHACADGGLPTSCCRCTAARGSAWCRPRRCCSGKPVVATDWSSTSEFLDAETAALVPASPGAGAGCARRVRGGRGGMGGAGRGGGGGVAAALGGGCGVAGAARRGGAGGGRRRGWARRPGRRSRGLGSA